LLGQARMYWRFARDLRKFLGQPVTLEMSRQIIKQRLQDRDRNLLAMVKRAVYDNRKSPYLKLLRSVGCEYGDFEQALSAEGIDNTLRMLCDKGVYITIEEFKGKQPARRGSTSWRFAEADFDNPLLTAHMHSSSSGSRSAGTRSIYDLDFLAANLALYNMPLFDAMGALGLPIALWMPAMPGVGPLNLLSYTKGGNIPRKWFSPLERSGFQPSLKNRITTRLIIYLARAAGVEWPEPEYVDYDNAWRVAKWMSETVKRDGGCVLDTYVSTAIRVCCAARERGLDIGGVRFLVGGEPLTETKRREMESTGAVVCVAYGISEAGFVGATCFNPAGVDDMHLFGDSFALIQRRRAVPHAGVHVDAFLFTSLIAAAPKVLFNTESGDCGVVENRSCGCRLDELGLNCHVYNVRGFDRITSEGMNFFGSDLIKIIEEVLPASFGGTSTDYQIVEEEDREGKTWMNIVVSPRLGEIDEAGLIRLVIDELAKAGEAPRMMSRLWLQAGTLKVRRMAPVTTSSGKLLPLHIKKTGQR
jgi:hypothetical protein